MLTANSAKNAWAHAKHANESALAIAVAMIHGRRLPLASAKCAINGPASARDQSSADINSPICGALMPRSSSHFGQYGMYTPSAAKAVDVNSERRRAGERICEARKDAAHARRAQSRSRPNIPLGPGPPLASIPRAAHAPSSQRRIEWDPLTAKT